MSRSFIRGPANHLANAAIFPSIPRDEILRRSLRSSSQGNLHREGKQSRETMRSLRGNPERLSEAAIRTRESLIAEYTGIGRSLALHDFQQDT